MSNFCCCFCQFFFQICFFQEFLLDIVVFVFFPICIIWRNSSMKKYIKNVILTSAIYLVLTIWTEKIIKYQTYFIPVRTNNGIIPTEFVVHIWKIFVVCLMLTLKFLSSFYQTFLSNYCLRKSVYFWLSAQPKS